MHIYYTDCQAEWNDAPASFSIKKSFFDLFWPLYTFFFLSFWKLVWDFRNKKRKRPWGSNSWNLIHDSFPLEITFEYFTERDMCGKERVPIGMTYRMYLHISFDLHCVWWWLLQDLIKNELINGLTKKTIKRENLYIDWSSFCALVSERVKRVSESEFL